MTEQNQKQTEEEALNATDQHLSENHDDLREHGYDAVHEDDSIIVYGIANGEEYANLLKAVDIDATERLESHLREAHYSRSREILADDEYASLTASAYPVVVLKR